MGTTIGLGGFGQNGRMHSLRHSEFHRGVQDVIGRRGLPHEEVRVDRADYGATNIILDKSGRSESIRVSGSSYDYGRANAEGRKRTCQLFERLLGDSMTVINVDPEPRESEQIIT